MALLSDRWIFRGYETLDDFILNRNPLYTSKKYPYVNRNPKKHKDKFIWILSKYFFDGGKENAKFWLKLENSSEFENCVFIYEDHEESSNLDYRWIEVMRRRRKGVYIKDACPVHIIETHSPNSSGFSVPVILPGYFPVYDKWNFKPFSIYDFSNENSKYKKLDFSKRDIDVLFIGKMATRRDVYIRKILDSATNLNVKHIIGSQFVSFEEHIDLMRRSKIAYQFMAIGYRSSREWEAMLNGCLLISDDRTVDFVNTPGMVQNVDFIRFDSSDTQGQMSYWLKNVQEREKIATNGFHSSWQIWSGCLDAYMPSRKKAAEKIIEAGWI